MAGLPDGFEIEQPSQGLPPGFEIEDQQQQQPPPPTGSLWENIKSLPGGIVQGLANTAAASGQAAQIEMGQPVTAPGGAESDKLIEQNITGPLPNTGIYGRRIGEALGNPGTYLSPGGPLVGAGVGALSGAGSAAGEQLTGSPWGGVAGGLLGGLAGGAGVTGLANRAARATSIPSTEDLFEAADAGYKAARGYGVEIDPRPVADLADTILSDLGNDGFRPINVPKTWAAVDELKNPAGNTVTVDDIDSVRKVLNRAGANPLEGAEREASRRAIGAIDDYMANLDPADVVNNAHYAGDVGAALTEARGNWAAGMRSQQIENRELRAGDIAGSTYTGGNINNAMRQQMRQILASPKQSRGFSADELAQMRNVVRGTPAGNISRLVGKLAVRGPVSLGLAGGLGALGMPMPLTMGLGEAGKFGGDLSTANQLQRLSDMVRQRSPLAQSRPPLQRMPLSPFALPGLVNAGNPYSGLTGP